VPINEKPKHWYYRINEELQALGISSLPRFVMNHVKLLAKFMEEGL